jgi:hypothetical protein
MRRVLTCGLFLAMMLAVVLSAAGQMEMPKPAPELKKLDYFTGTWKFDGDMKPGPMGPGGKVTGMEHNKWMDGGFFLESQSGFNGPMGKSSGMSYMGYDANDKMYTYDEFNSMGEAVHSKGMLDGNTWTWTNEEKMNGQTMKGRFIIKAVSATSYNFKFEMSQDGTNWMEIMNGTGTKQK